MKEVRYNDKLWFGKHKGVRLCDVIRHDPCFIQKMIKENKFTLDKKSNKLLNGENVDNQPIDAAMRAERPAPNLNPFLDPIPVVEEEQLNPRVLEREGLNQIFKSRFMINRNILDLPEEPRNTVIKHLFRDSFHNIYIHMPADIGYFNLCDDILVYFSDYFISYINETALVGNYSVILTINDVIIHKLINGIEIDPDDIYIQISDEQNNRHVKSFID